MLTTAACPEASRNRGPSSATIQQPSPREATGKVFLKWRGKRPVRVRMRYTGMNCNKVQNRPSALSNNLSRGEGRSPPKPRYFVRKGKVTAFLLLPGDGLTEM